ncbi:aminotransferase class IV [Streptomyces roseoverticillatus]|uniref:Aminotransferase class IV n=1 Tax=Streptomyces roseoverticillatus TaxID=66429 RepID=A0ABV3IX21_9ACTN
MNDLVTPYVQVDGRAVDADPLFLALMGGYGHMTAMQIRDGRVRGLDFHLTRLDTATKELFGEGLEGELVRDRIRCALDAAGVRDASARVYVYAPEPGDRTVTAVILRPAVPEPGPQRLRSVPYSRPTAHLKHVGVFGQAYHLRQVKAAGFDEALLVEPDGTVAEGAITNVGFLEGDTVVWPSAPALDGITMLVLQRELDRSGLPWRRQAVRLDEVARFDAAFVCNSVGVSTVSLIDDVRFPLNAESVRTLKRLYETAAWDVI